MASRDTERFIGAAEVAAGNLADHAHEQDKKIEELERDVERKDERIEELVDSLDEANDRIKELEKALELEKEKLDD